ncbi:MAG: cysteine--tRNA ligase, partial [Fimbriimonadaceae bacterium]|nr:cysteine--tRNA ligase [Alphaproteobacteria bacterium]
MDLKFHNTLTRRKEVFKPIDPANVRMYVCGPTVYESAHIGNARPVLVFDVLFRLLRHIYGAEHVTYVRNITDVDDKINARAAEEGRPIAEITAETTRQFHEDIAALGVLKPTVEPRATRHIAEMIRMIEKLIDSGHAYVGDGHVLFRVDSMEDYGQLAGRSTDEMLAGARVDVAPYKKDPMDFVMWKPSSADLPGWDSPWGRGRPGWHIECSAMAEKYLGQEFDIHAGGIDLVFPHHENELAQSRCCFDTPVMANYWLHNGFLQVEGEKMSKSLGNFLTIHELLTAWPGEVLRLTMLATHYRQPINWTETGLKEAEKTLDSWFAAVGGVDAPGDIPDTVIEALKDDINTPKAIAALHALRAKAVAGDKDAAASLLAGANLMGLLQYSQKDWQDFKYNVGNVDEAEIDALIVQRNAARAARDWAQADRIRDTLDKMGIVIMDGPDGTKWE